MDKTGKFVVTLVIIALIGWTFYNANHQPPPPQQTTSLTANSTTAATPVAASAPAATPVAPPPVAQPTVPERTLEVKATGSETVDYVFTNLGGGIKTADLKGHIAEKGADVLLNQNCPSAIGAVSQQPGAAAIPAKLSQQGDKVIAVSEFAPGIEMIKTYTLPTADAKGKARYLVKLDIAFKNTAQSPLAVSGYFVSLGGASPMHEHDMESYTALNWSKNGKSEESSVSSFKGSWLSHTEKSVIEESAENVPWASVTSQYFVTLFTAKGEQGKSIWSVPFPVKFGEKSVQGIRGDLGMSGFSLKPGETHTQSFEIYAGPKRYAYLKQFSEGQVAVMQFGMFGFIAIWLLDAMNALAAVLRGNYALAIIALTLIIKLLLWIPQNKATRSMKKMQLVQPKMKELREKFKDDPTKMNQETMKLYKTYGINPLGGCLPMLIQIPVFFGFYAMLRSSFELRDQAFLWVKDLSQPDTIAHISGFPINILPVLMGLTSIWSMSLTPKSGDGMQQRLMMFMPLIFIAFCYNYASALSLYLTTSYLFTVAQLYITRNQQTPTLVKAAAPAKKKR